MKYSCGVTNEYERMSHSFTFTAKLLQKQHVSMVQFIALQGLAIGRYNLCLEVSASVQGKFKGRKCMHFMNFLIQGLGGVCGLHLHSLGAIC